MKSVKILAVEQNRTLQDVIAELLRRGLESHQPQQRHRVKLPLIDCSKSSAEMTPEALAQILLEQETDDSLRY